MIRLLLVRHGETEWNRQKRFQGQRDIPLNEFGRQQVSVLSRRLKNEAINARYTSDLSRAWETAKSISTINGELVMIKDSRLREMNFGEWEGLTWAEIREKDPSVMENWSKYLAEKGPPGGETLFRFSERILKFSEEINKTHLDETVLLVAHGGTIMVLICLLLGHPIEKYWQFRIEKASISDISVYPEGVIINQLNDTSHLGLK
jgi:alpha-ribazole phosphatase/probable phosphoglycerate mutase